MQNNERKMELVSLLAEECGSVADIQKVLKELFSGTIEKMLEAEMDEHLGYEKNDVKENNSGNSRNGYSRKTINSEWGTSELSVLRDRSGDFRPKVIEKRQTRTDDLENKILAMYAKGMSNRDIEDHLKDIYGVTASAGLISKITDKIMPEVSEWQNRPLDSVYAVIFLDGVMFKVRRDSKVINKCVYSFLGITMEGKKEILGFRISENESASFYAGILNELKNRGVKDILIACHDNLNGLSSAISTVFHQTEQQLCVIHQIRNSISFVSYKDLKPLMSDLKKIYTSVSEEQGL
jgi:putative transposase